MGEHRYGISLRVSKHSKWVRYQVEHEKRSAISASSHVLFCFLYIKHTTDDYFWWFSKDFWSLPKDSPKVVQRPDNRSRSFSENCRRLLKISKDSQRFPRKHRYLYRDYVTIAMVFFTSENNMLFSHVKISCLHAKAHLVFHWHLSNKNFYQTATNC